MGRPDAGPTIEWIFALRFRQMEDYGIGPAPTDRRPDGTRFITADHPSKVRP